MELKDVILSTLAEMEEELPQEGDAIEKQEKSQIQEEIVTSSKETTPSSVEGELYFLDSIRERLLVLFEGFQAPNNTKIEAKIDMTLNFLEYTLATIDARVEKLQKGTES